MVEDRPRAEVDPRQFGPACLDRGPGIRRLPPVGRRALLLGGAMTGLFDDPATSWTSWWTPPPPPRRPGRRTRSGAWRRTAPTTAPALRRGTHSGSLPPRRSTPAWSTQLTSSDRRSGRSTSRPSPQNITDRRDSHG